MGADGYGQGGIRFCGDDAHGLLGSDCRSVLAFAVSGTRLIGPTKSTRNAMRPSAPKLRTLDIRPWSRS
jgi:hypothetical protein